jgi:transcription elongation factor Elf1
MTSEEKAYLAEVSDDRDAWKADAWAANQRVTVEVMAHRTTSHLLETLTDRVQAVLDDLVGRGAAICATCGVDLNTFEHSDTCSLEALSTFLDTLLYGEEPE